LILEKEISAVQEIRKPAIMMIFSRRAVGWEEEYPSLWKRSFEAWKDCKPKDTRKRSV
jgi:hypothetical protein